jgi:S1-C subfamily serine protease
MLTGKEIYGINREAVVQIGIGNQFSGDGFLVPDDGIVVTANHVVTTRESGFRQCADDIKVRVVRAGVVTIYSATPIEPQVSDDQVNFDSAGRKIASAGLPHVTLGSWDEVDVGSQVTIIPSFPGPETLMLQGPVSGKVAAANGLGPKPANTVFFQCPVRNGFSGAPMFSSSGRVIGIVDTKVFGISPALDTLRSNWVATRTGGSVSVFGVDLAGSFLEVINNLDQNLISGLGSGIAIEYAKKQRDAAKKTAP